MAQRKKIEVFSAGCTACLETVEAVRRVAGTDHDIAVLDMHMTDVAIRAKRLGIRSVPTVLIDGNLLACCTGRGFDERILKSDAR